MEHTQLPDQAWYDQEPAYPGGPVTEVHERLFPHVKQLEEDQSDIHLQNVLNSRLYTNREPMTFTWNEDITAHFRPLNANVENIIQSVVEALSAAMSTNRPKATIVPRGASFSTYLKSKRLDKFLWGEFIHHKLHAKVDRVFKDAAVFGTGFLKMDIDRDEIYVERVHPDEIVVDQRECVSNDKPLQMHHRKLVSRLWLQKTYGQGDSKDAEKRRKAIADAQSRNFSYTSYRNPGEGQVVLIESWKLPTRPGAGDGRHTICIDNCTLLDESYTEDDFPILTIKYADPDHGFYGRSLVGDLIGYQIRQNELNDVIRVGQDVMCVPRMLVEHGSRVVGQQFDNVLGKEVRYTGTKPEAVTWGAFNTEIYNERDRNKTAAFEFAGVSQMRAQQKFPNQFRADSSEAIREMASTQDERFNPQAQRQEDFYKEAAARLIDLNTRLHKNEKVNRSVVFRGQNLAEQIDWREVDMDRDKYVLEISTSSIVNMTPAARKDTLNDWLNRGLITPEHYKMWAGNPDLERISQTGAASTEYIEFMIDKLMNPKVEAPVPDPYMNLAEAFGMVHKQYMHLRSLDDTPEEVIVRFLDWIDLAEDLLNPEPDAAEQMAPQPGEMPPMGGMPAEMGMDPAAMGMDPAMAGMDMAAGGPMPMDPGVAMAPMGGM